MKEHCHFQVLLPAAILKVQFRGIASLHFLSYFVSDWEKLEATDTEHCKIYPEMPNTNANHPELIFT